MVKPVEQQEAIPVHGFAVGDIAVFECPCGQCGNMVLLNRKTGDLCKIPAEVFVGLLNAMIQIQNAIERGELPGATE